MELGTGIFLSSLFVGTVVLYVFTRDRWKWKRISAWLGGGLVTVGVLGGGGVWLWMGYTDKPRPLEEFWGLRPGMPQDEVKFRKGEPFKPAKNQPPEIWVYEPNDKKGWYLVTYKENSLRYVGYHGSPLSGPYVQGVSSVATPETLAERFGTPSNVSTSVDGLSRIYSFDKYRLFVQLDASSVQFYGIYDPKTGPVTFRHEAVK